MRTRLTALLLVAALAAVAFIPAAGANEANEQLSINGTLTFAPVATDFGTVRGVLANFNLVNFEVGDVDDEEPGGVVVRLYDATNPARTISQVTLRADALSATPGVDPNGTSLTAPIDSVWGSFDYAADGYWIQPRNLRINGGNCERIGGAEVTVQLLDGGEVNGTIEGPPRGSCADIRP